ncbi:uracil-DNA glycosylase [Sulfitobacter sp. F26204]|uniref:uracil-DNA glycosylase n=1 Tax=Sulfitobacter sp. F26204 TaxID=2996014 RepID=UPI00225DEEB5|nr:uracil-DNA glycosylase [Sulfitobacter sp. F26204]MCX7558785.1 uracil-DNA glycosylase [Sulfitobacter sp. F26204]
MESANFHYDRAMLEWQIELGATEAILDRPVNRYDAPAAEEKPKLAAPSASGVTPAVKVDHVAVAESAAAAAGTLDELREAIAAFDLCDLKKGARNLVFSDGIAGARVMLVGEAPGRDEDVAGKPFVGRAGDLLDKMLAAIRMGRASAQAPVYITSVLPWRPPQNRDPKPDEIAMMRPFLLRHIELAAPDVLLLAGNWPCQALLGKRGITRLRGQWTEVAGRPALPMFHPAYLLRSPEYKREAWADLLSLQKRLRDG